MIDLKKAQFCSGLKNFIKENPTWAADSIQAITDGVSEAVENWKHDQSRMAALLMQFYLSEKSMLEISKESKLRTIEYLSRYFKTDHLV
jgi:predicted trehalose synthase